MWCGVLKQRGGKMEPPCGPSGTMVYLPYITKNRTFYAKDTENIKKNEKNNLKKK